MDKINSTVAKSLDGTVQITFTIPFNLIKETQEKVLQELARETDVPGFRKGKAPLEKIREKIDKQTFLEKSLKLLLPKALGKVITVQKLRPAIYPKFEVVSAKEGEDWQIRAVTCELPEIILGDYKKAIQSAESHSAKASRDEKEQEVVKVLLETIKINIPKLLIDEEVNLRLANLLQRIEKLGLTLEGYLASLAKTPESLRGDYETQAKKTIALDLILTKISQEEKINISAPQIDAALKAASADPKLYKSLDTPEQRLLIRGVLARRQALDLLVSLM